MAKDQEEKDKSKKLGIQSLILSIIGAVIMIAMVAIATVLAQNINESLAGNYSFPVMSLFGAIVFYAFAFIGLMLLLNSISFANFQRKINKHRIGKVALIVSLVLLLISIVTTVVLIVVML